MPEPLAAAAGTPAAPPMFPPPWVQPAPASARAEQPAPAATPAPPVSADQPVPAVPIVQGAPPAPAPVIRPAAQAFGAALHRAVVAERRPAPTTGEPAPLFLAPVPMAAPAAAPTPPLDMTQPRWPDAMITRIEQIRDVQNAADTRIRLHPDALGHVDVAVRREGEAVHVHFAAAEPATRTLLAEAQPRLQELAEAKGLKLAQSQVDSGAGNNGERRQPAAQQPATPSRPASARDAATAHPTDTRLA